MALEVAVGTLNVVTTAIGTTVTVSGLAFQPKLVLFSWTGRTAVGQAEGDHKFGMGCMASATKRGGHTSQSVQAAGTSASDQRTFNNNCILLQTTAGAVDGAADFDAFLSDGFRVIITDVFTTTYLVNYMAIGGSDLTDVDVVSVTSPTVIGTQDVAVAFALNTGLDDKAVIILGGGDDLGFNATDVYSQFGVGVAAGDTIVNAIMGGNSLDAQGTSDTGSYCFVGDCIGTVSVPANPVTRRASITTWLSTGFRLNWVTVDVDPNPYLAIILKGGRYRVGDSLTSTGGTNQVEATPYIPKGLLVASHNKAQSAAATPQAQDERSVGFVAGASARNYVSIIDVDALGTTDIGVAQNTDEMYANQSTAGAIAIEGLMDLVSFDATPSFTFVMDDPDPVASFFWYLLMADTPAGPPGPNALMLVGVGQ